MTLTDILLVCILIVLAINGDLVGRVRVFFTAKWWADRARKLRHRIRRAGVRRRKRRGI